MSNILQRKTIDIANIGVITAGAENATTSAAPARPTLQYNRSVQIAQIHSKLPYIHACFDKAAIAQCCNTGQVNYGTVAFILDIIAPTPVMVEVLSLLSFDTVLKLLAHRLS